MSKPESLHNHTIKSDGKLSHLETLKFAEQYGYGVIAFTDHDQLPSKETLQQLRDYDGPVGWTCGIEITSALHKEAEESSAIHLLGLFVDPHDKPLLQHCQVLRDSRVERMKFYVQHLTSLGFTITEDDCFQTAGESLIGSPHIVAALERHPENAKLQDKLMKRMEAAAQHDESVAFRYQRMMDEGPRQYPYVLFMKKSSFVPVPPGEFHGALLDLDTSVRLIRQAGGLAIMAHWHFEKKKLPKATLEELIKSKRLDGVETEIKNLILERDLSIENTYLHKLAAQYNAIDTIGSDAHDEFDMECFAKSEAGERSAGQTAHIIRQAKPSLKWSNLDHALV